MFKNIPNKWEISGSVLMFISGFVPLAEEVYNVYTKKKSIKNGGYNTDDIQINESDATVLL